MMAKAAAKGPARDAGYWREQIEALRKKRAKVSARTDDLSAEQGTAALEVHAGGAKSTDRLDLLSAEAIDVLRVLTQLDAALLHAERCLLEAEAAEAEEALAARRARRETLLAARAENARRAEDLITALGETLAEMRAQAEAIMEMTAGRDMAETLKPIKTDHRLQLAMARAGFTWRDRQGTAHPLFLDAPGFAKAEVEAQAAYAARGVR